MNLVNCYLFVCVFSAVKCISIIFSQRNAIRHLLKEFNEPAAIFDSSAVATKWIEQPIDHFNETDTRKWKMRYYQRLDMWKAGGPVYLVVGGEFKIFKSFLTKGTTYDLANETNGAIFFCEHRYYGESKPFNDFTSENLRYLHSRQALADVAQLIQNLKKRPDYAESKFVIVGASYGGNLAAWLKLLYPDLADATVASSSPVEAKSDFYENLETVGDDFKKYGSPTCYKKIEHMFKEYEIKLQTKNGTEKLKKQLNVCPESDLTKLENKQMLFFATANYYSWMLEMVYEIDIKTICNGLGIIVNELLANNENLIIWKNKENCFKCEFNEIVKYYKRNPDETAYMYQTCTEFGHYMTTSSDNQPFTKNIPLDFYVKICTAMFGKEFDANRVEKGVKKTNKMYGGLKLNVTKVVFVNGELDPWHRLGILKDISSEAPALLIPKSSHCHDLYSEHERDPKELKEARKHIKNLVKKWIGAEENAITKPQN